MNPIDPQRPPHISPPGLATRPLGVEPDVALAARTTLGVGGRADLWALAENLAHLQSLLRWARTQDIPVWVMGEGSNVVVHDRGVRGLVVSLRACDGDSVRVVQQDGQGVTVEVQGGACWNDVALALASMGLYGAEALYGIPGTAGAAPVQNIGAYGQDIGQTLEAVTLVNVATGDVTVCRVQDLALGYRTSRLRRDWAGRWVVAAIRLRLSLTRARPLVYPSLVGALKNQGLDPDLASAVQVAQTVYQVREQRGMVWPKDGSAKGTVGSFFTNPVVAKAHSQILKQQHPVMPLWPGAAGDKLSAAWLIEASGVPKGWRCDAVGQRVGTSSHHALALINEGHASAQDICLAATLIYQQVLERTGVALRAEAQRVGFMDASAPFDPGPA